MPLPSKSAIINLRYKSSSSIPLYIFMHPNDILIQLFSHFLKAAGKLKAFIN